MTRKEAERWPYVTVRVRSSGVRALLRSVFAEVDAARVAHFAADHYAPFGFYPLKDLEFICE